VIAGLMVDQVHQIVQLAPSRFQAAPSTLAPGYGGYVWGVCDYGLHTMVGLDVDSLLGAEALHGESALPV
jgi:chemotaxis signal transduction protein